MIGGLMPVVTRLDPIFKTLAPVEVTLNGPRDGAAWRGRLKRYLHCGPAGAGHFVKMIRNMVHRVWFDAQAYAEGFEICRHANAKNLPR